MSWNAVAAVGMLISNERNNVDMLLYFFSSIISFRECIMRLRAPTLPQTPTLPKPTLKIQEHYMGASER